MLVRRVGRLSGVDHTEFYGSSIGKVFIGKIELMPHFSFLRLLFCLGSDTIIKTVGFVGWSMLPK